MTIDQRGLVRNKKNAMKQLELNVNPKNPFQIFLTFQISLILKGLSKIFLVKFDVFSSFNLKKCFLFFLLKTKEDFSDQNHFNSRLQHFSVGAKNHLANSYFVSSYSRVQFGGSSFSGQHFFLSESLRQH